MPQRMFFPIFKGFQWCQQRLVFWTNVVPTQPRNSGYHSVLITHWFFPQLHITEKLLKLYVFLHLLPLKELKVCGAWGCNVICTTVYTVLYKTTHALSSSRGHALPLFRDSSRTISNKKVTNSCHVELEMSILWGWFTANGSLWHFRRT